MRSTHNYQQSCKLYLLWGMAKRLLNVVLMIMWFSGWTNMMTQLWLVLQYSGGDKVLLQFAEFLSKEKVTNNDKFSTFNRKTQ